MALLAVDPAVPFTSGAWMPWLLWGCLLLLAAVVAQAARLLRSRQQLSQRLTEARSELAELRHRDALTGLPNRAEFDAQIDAAAVRADRGLVPLTVMVLGLDNFRAINDAWGLRVGDALLVQAGERLAGFAGDARRVARASGDEFLLLLETGMDDALVQAERVRQRMSQPYLVEGQTLLVGVSVGIAVYPEHGARPRLAAHAALAMRSVKMGGGGGHALYDPAMSVNQRAQAELLQDLRQALARHEFELFYQPKIDARTLQITAAEALLRWQHPRLGMISPVTFIPLAERHGLIADIGLWVIEEACRQASQWRERGLRMRIAVNISGHQLRRDDLVDQLEASLARHHIPAGRMTCEITESVAMEDTAVTRAAFERLGRAGLHVSIDDFGTGHSSLAALRRLPAAELKIDRAFVTDLDTSEDARSIVRAIVQMAHSLQLLVVAEGVETEAQRDQLVKLGCDELQGFLFAKPMSAQALALWAEDDSEDEASAFKPSLFMPTEAAPLDP
jgi:diguanylate cyclase (GGDEF)-like protein